MKTRATLILLLAVSFAGNAGAQPEPGVLLEFEHWAYDVLAHLDYALNGALLSGVTQQQDPRVTRGQCAIFVLQSMRLFLMTGYDPGRAAADQPPPRRGTASLPPPLGEEALKWRTLALEFLPEIIAVGEPVESLGGDAWWPSCCLIDISATVGWHTREPPAGPPREPAPVVRGYAKNTAIETLRSIHHDHWLYPETQRVLWAAAEMEYTRAPRDENVTPADTLPPDHWAYQSRLQLAPVAFPGRELNVLGDRAPTRYEIAL
ncbi:MAG: hypothetical protein GF393_00935, partial [Armatimonadia bacterium]|nr:hypothetical protein [Armatimonadia bacterium]